jgi:uncharacterized membrane protein HdeD (DUF308 family)
VPLQALKRNWWMIAARGGLAILFGLTLFVPDVTLSMVVVLFGAYAILDGLWAVASVMWTSRRSGGALAVTAEGLVSVALGVLALSWPMVPREFIRLVAEWGVLTGILEIVAAAAIPRERASRWLLGTAGVCSVFLAILVQMMPDADVTRAIYLIGAYAIAFGIVVTLAARRFRGDYRAVAALPARRVA